VTERLVADIRRIVASPNFEAGLGNLGVQPMDVPLAELQRKELVKWGAAVRAAGVTLE
jgi:hypothetical protein